MPPITFPNLNLSFDINPVAFTIGDKQIFWYGLIITSGIILALVLGYFRLKETLDVDKIVKKQEYKFSLTWNDIVDFVLYAIPIGVICARIYYVIFSWDYYSEHLLDIFKIWNGGIAIYGAVIGGILTAIIYCRIKDIHFLNLADFCVPYLALCQSIGRWGNFTNREAYGTVTDSFFKMGLWDNASNAYTYVHPTFLYESFCTLIIFILLIKLSKKRKFEGQIFYAYMVLYGFIRFAIEGLRTDSLYFLNTDIRVSQLLAIIFAVVFLIVYTIKEIKHKQKA